MKNLTWMVCVGLWVAGCSPGRGPLSIRDEDPASRIPAMKQAVAAGDRSVIPVLIECLDDEDAAVRLFAISSLEKFTQNRLGYEYYDDAAQRQPALERWRQWLKEHPDLR